MVRKIRAWGHRVVAKGDFQALADIHAVVEKLFG
jgi:hypothetical protein